MSLLSATVKDPPRLQQPFLFIQSSIAQSGVPLLRQILASNLTTRSSNHFLLFSFIYPSADILRDVSPLPENIDVFDWLDSVPGYSDGWSDPRAKILSAVEKAPPGAIQVVIDSVDTLCADIGSVSETYTFLSDLLAIVRARPSPSRLVLHATRPSQLIPLLTQPTFSPSIIQLIAHPVALLIHLAREYLTPPPPFSPKAKFWSAFLPLSERIYDVERLVYEITSNGEGSGGVAEIVFEIIVRGGEGRKRSIERELEGWSSSSGPCDLTKLDSLKGVCTKKAIVETGPDPTQNVSFNLNLTSSQQESRAQVPLPYAHEGNPAKSAANTTSAIFYDPDSADDIDDDDPDEDLDI
ncbi:hypothetical protein H0H87_003854 [Tephrocybe sp. NHM501043]|nr:hypothetical protein H0H87_003854 [Tephrocybe sp. NHM501043]